MEIGLCIDANDFLSHHGILGQEWGVRKYQYKDGSLTEEGRFHYGLGYSKQLAKTAGTMLKGLKGKSVSGIKTDALDYANRKGFLDFLDSKANAKMDSIYRQTKEKEPEYKSAASKDPFKAMSNMDRYLDMAGYGGKTANSSRYDNRSRDSEKFSKAMDFITNPQNKKYCASGKKWMDAIISRTGQSVADKKLGMMSKDARDIEREASGRSFVAELKKNNWDVTKLTDRWYKTDTFHAVQPRFKGQVHEVIEAKVADKWHWEDHPDGRGSQMKVDTWKTEKRAGGLTKEFIDFRKSLTMPSDYSHVTKPASEAFVKDIASMASSFMKHGECFHDLDDYLEHHGTKGQKWGQRKYQNSDGSLTPLGRLHYGVGNAKRATGSAASKAGAAIKKKVNPSEADLQEKYRKALQKQHRHELKEATKDAKRAAKGKEKRIKSMTDDEVRQNIQRIQNEKQLEALRKESRASTKALNVLRAGGRTGAKAVGTGAKFTAKLAGATIGGLGKFAAASMGTLAKEFVNQGTKKLVGNIFKDKKSDEELASEKIKRDATDSKNSLDFMKNMLSMQALSGDKDAAERLREFNSINSKDKKKNNNNNDNSNNNNNNNNNNNKGKQKGKKNNLDNLFRGDKPGYDYSGSRDGGFGIAKNSFSVTSNDKNYKVANSFIKDKNTTPINNILPPDKED